MIAAPNNTYAGIRSVQYGASGHKYVDFNPYEAIEEAFDLSGKETHSHLLRHFILEIPSFYQDSLGTIRLKALKRERRFLTADPFEMANLAAAGVGSSLGNIGNSKSATGERGASPVWVARLKERLGELRNCSEASCRAPAVRPS